jgi:hypothetical protein
MKRNSMLAAAGAVIVVCVLVAVLVFPALVPKTVYTQGTMSMQKQGATYFGAAGSAEHIESMVKAADGAVYFSGTITGNEALPYVAGGHDAFMSGGSELFVAKMSPDMKQLIALTYLGGGGAENNSALCLDSNGDVLVSGWSSSANHLGIEAGAAADDEARSAESPAPVGSIFVTRLSSDLSTVKGSGILGQAEPCPVFLAVNDDFIYVVATKGVSGGMSVEGVSGSHDAVIWRIEPNLTAAISVANVGGLGVDSVGGLCLLDDGSPVLAGTCGAALAAAPAGALSSYSQGKDGFIAVMAPDLSSMSELAYITGPGDQSIVDLELDEHGRLFFLGESSAAMSQMSPGGFDTSFEGASNCYVGRLATSFSAVEAITYLGNAPAEAACLELMGEMVAVAMSTSGGAPLTHNAMDLCANGGTDVSLLILDQELSKLAYGSYIGSGSGTESANAHLFSPSDGQLFVATETDSAGLQCHDGAFDGSFAGGSDAHITCLAVPDNEDA